MKSSNIANLTIVHHTFHLHTVIRPLPQKQRLKLRSRITRLGPRKMCSLPEKGLVEPQASFNLSLCCSAVLKAYLCGEKA